MRTIFAFLAIASSTLAVHDWAIFGSKTLGDVSVARRDVAMGGIFDLSRREFGPDTAVDANNTLSDCQAADVGESHAAPAFRPKTQLLAVLTVFLQ